MDIVGFFRILIPALLAILGGGLVLAMVGIFVGNTCFIFMRCFKKESSMEEVYKSKEREKIFDFPGVGKEDKKLSRAS